MRELDPKTKQYLEADFRHILEHPRMTTDMKTGYLVAVVMRGGEGVTNGLTSIETAVQVLSAFVREYIAQNY